MGRLVEGDVITSASVASGGMQDDFVGSALVELDACIPPSGSWFLFYSIQEVQRATNDARPAH
jgi:hypothetical protein